jgi:predicted acyl esterase
VTEAMARRSADRARLAYAVLALALTLAATMCSEGGEGGDDPGAPAPGDGAVDEGSDASSQSSSGPADSTGSSSSQFSTEIRASPEQVTVTGAAPGQMLTVRGGPEPLTGTADELGNLIFRDVPAGDGYRVVSGDGTEEGDDEIGESEPFTVPTLDDHPDAAFYEAQALEPGFGYIETRDGTLLSVMVRLPGPVDGGPYPTVVEYSGYTPSDPDEPQPAMGLAGQLGFATVGVNVRGTGCSGGAFDFFEPLQSLDGYDAIEVISRQAWVEGGQVGMVGLSYPGITQLFVARYRPPGLKAITPMSVIEDTYRSTLFPGGIRNVGFAKRWADDRQGDALPLAEEFAQDRVEGGDQICADNQLLRSQAVDLESEVRLSDYYVPEEYDPIAPRTFVSEIDVPVFIAGQWQDEQTGARFATMLDDFSGTDVLRAHLANGAHADGFGPVVLHRWAEFLDFYVKEEIPEIPSGLRALAPLGYAEAFGVAMDLPPDRFTDFGDYASALAAYEAEPPVLLLLENGGDPDRLGGPIPRSTVSFDSWPPPAARMIGWNLGDRRELVAGGVTEVADEPATYTPDPTEGSVLMTERSEDSSFADLVWPEPPVDASLAWTSEPLAEDMLLAGTGLLKLGIATAATDVDIEATISEIRPDGTEVYVQSGWLRASHRGDTTEGAVDLDVPHSHLESDARPIDDRAVMLVEIFPVAHPFRAGSRIRLTVDTPGGSRPEWEFEVLETTEPVTILQGRLDLPMITGLTFPDGYPACSPGLRSQPCRPAR